MKRLCTVLVVEGFANISIFDKFYKMCCSQLCRLKIGNLSPLHLNRDNNIFGRVNVYLICVVQG